MDLHQLLALRQYELAVASEAGVEFLHGVFESVARADHVLGEVRHALVKVGRLLDHVLGLLRLLMLQPGEVDRRKEAHEGRGRGEEDAHPASVDDELIVSLERGAEERFGRKEEDDLVERRASGGGLGARVVLVGEHLDRRAELGGVCFHQLLPVGRGLVDERDVEFRNLGVDDHAAVSRQEDDEVRAGVALGGLLDEVAMLAEARGFDDATKGLFAPLAAMLRGFEHGSEIVGAAR